MSERTRVRIVGDHPHRGEVGSLIEGRTIRVLGGPPMFEVKLDRPITAEECYAETRHLLPLKRDEDPDAT